MNQKLTIEIPDIDKLTAEGEMYPTGAAVARAFERLAEVFRNNGEIDYALSTKHDFDGRVRNDEGYTVGRYQLITDMSEK